MKEKIPIQFLAYNILHQVPDDLFFEEDPLFVCEKCYMISNIGNMDSYFRKSPKSVKGIYLSRMTEVRHLYNMFFLHTFGGRFYFTLSYAMEFIKPEIALDQCNEIIRILTDNL